MSLSHFLSKNEITKLGQCGPKLSISNFPSALKELKGLFSTVSTVFIMLLFGAVLRLLGVVETSYIRRQGSSLEPGLVQYFCVVSDELCIHYHHSLTF